MSYKQQKTQQVNHVADMHEDRACTPAAKLTSLRDSSPSKLSSLQET